MYNKTNIEAVVQLWYERSQSVHALRSQQRPVQQSVNAIGQQRQPVQQLAAAMCTTASTVSQNTGPQNVAVLYDSPSCFAELIAGARLVRDVC